VVAIQATASAGGGAASVAFGLHTTATAFYATPVANQTPQIVYTAVANGFQGGTIANLGSVLITIVFEGTPVAGNGQPLAAGQTYDLSAYEACRNLGIVTASSSSAFYVRRIPAP
jgi:hypothetical protein